MTTLGSLKRKLLRNPGVRAGCEALKLEERLAADLTRLRVKAARPASPGRSTAS